MAQKKVDKRRIGQRQPRRKRVTLKCRSQEAQNIFVAGSFNNWDPAALPLKRNTDGDWSVDVLLHKGRYEFKFIVDGEWLCFPEFDGGDHIYEDCVLNEHGTMNHVLEVA